MEKENRQLEIFDLLRVNLKVFAGPLDLLLDLIRRKKMDIRDVSLAEICKPYLEQLELMEAINMDIAIEFLDIASTLILIKSKSLLPRDADFVDDDESMGTEEQLKQKLIEYQRYQSIAETLNQRELLGRELFGRPEVDELDREEGMEIFEDLSVYTLIKAYRQLIVKKGYRKPHEVVSESYSLEEKILEFLKIFQTGEMYPFAELCPHRPSKAEIIISFMAILELARLFLLQIQQVQEFSVLHCQPNSNIGDYLSQYEESIPSAS